jgi:hypothetical protein
MPFIRGRYHINPVAGAALEAARDAEAALLALQHEAEEADPDAESIDDDFPDGNRLASSAPGPIHRVEIEAAELVPAHSGRAAKGFVARVHRAAPANGAGASSGAASGGSGGRPIVRTSPRGYRLPRAHCSAPAGNTRVRRSPRPREFSPRRICKRLQSPLVASWRFSRGRCEPRFSQAFRLSIFSVPLCLCGQLLAAMLIRPQAGRIRINAFGRSTALTIWDAPSGRTRHWRKRGHSSPPMPGYAQVTVVALAVAIVISAGWGIVNRVRAAQSKETLAALNAAKASALANSGPFYSSAQVPGWERDVMLSLDAGLADAHSGNITASEVDADRAASILEAARVRSERASPDFFSRVLDQLDHILMVSPENERLAEHTRLARIDLAELRSSMMGSATMGSATSGSLPARPASVQASTARPSEPRSSTSRSRDAADTGSRISIYAPRTIAANQELNPAMLGGDYLDATLMPESAEVLEPPASRLFADNVRVSGLTIAGAAQTLDGIHWHDVTFIGTRLRYESGPLDLQNVQFIHCTFGFPTDERGARLANAIAQGQTSFALE